MFRLNQHTPQFIKQFYLYPEDLYVSNTPTQIVTILGTCVSVCLFDEKLKTGGINHFIMPVANNDAYSPLRFGDKATIELIKKMEKMGSQRKDIRAKLFGGSVQTSTSSNSNSVGPKNSLIAEQILQKENIRIIQKRIGGNVGRKIIFYTDTGEVFVKLLKQQQIQNVT